MLWYELVFNEAAPEEFWIQWSRIWNTFWVCENIDRGFRIAETLKVSQNIFGQFSSTGLTHPKSEDEESDSVLSQFSWLEVRELFVQRFPQTTLQWFRIIGFIRHGDIERTPWCDKSRTFGINHFWLDSCWIVHWAKRRKIVHPPIRVRLPAWGPNGSSKHELCSFLGTGRIFVKTILGKTIWEIPDHTWCGKERFETQCFWIRNDEFRRHQRKNTKRGGNVLSAF